MTAEEKAHDLINKFAPKCSGNSQTLVNKQLAKQCAIICCEEIMGNVTNPMNPCTDETFDFWKEVINEINKM